ncbi:MAG: hypothetical protein E7436_02190 [Ruminococcaceae bacterium]|nr:hypothetical protein [Oscillospiraceae bacterium]
MTKKQLAFIILCALLVLVVVLACVLLVRINQLFGGTDTPEPTTAPTVPTDPTAAPTIPTNPTGPTAAPTDPTEPPMPTLPTVPPTEPSDHVHDYVLTESANATCTTYGYSLYTCAICGQQSIPTEETSDPLGHNFGAGELIAGSCTTDGCTRYHCSRCGYAEDRNIQPAAGHSFVLTEQIHPGCETEGCQLYCCTACGAEERRDIVPALEHDFLLVETQYPSCDEEGFERYVCQRCGAEHRDPLAATGHSFTVWGTDENGAHYCICTRCNATIYAAGMSVTGVQASSGEGNSCRIYVISVGIREPGGWDEPNILLYTVYDYRNADTPTYTFDPTRGLVVTYIGTLGDEECLVIPLLQTEPEQILAG